MVGPTGGGGGGSGGRGGDACQRRQSGLKVETVVGPKNLIYGGT